MKYVLMPSLERRTLIRIAITLWNQAYIKDLMKKLDFLSIIKLCDRNREWQVVEDKVVENALKLLLPESPRNQLLDFIKPIGLEILKWREYHESILSERRFGRENLNKLCWTSEGTVDKKKTAEVLMKDENLDISKRYKLACIYCLEKDIPKLWDKIPENHRKYFYSEDPIKVKQQDLVVLWTYDIKGEVAKLDYMIEKRWQRRCFPYQYAFEYAAVGGNKAATEYFLQKLTPKERKESLVKYAGCVANRRCVYDRNPTDFPKEHYTDVLCFLFTQMDEDQQMKVFKTYPCKVLNCLLDLPWQDLFIETANRLWDFLSKGDYDDLLRIIIVKITKGYKDCNYQKLWRILATK